MIVCHCNRVTAADIEAQCLGGAATQGEIRARCGAGNRCGGCRPVVQRIVASYHEGTADRPCLETAVPAALSAAS
jgi:bacterioferritin-associated ferredoxin